MKMFRTAYSSIGAAEQQPLHYGMMAVLRAPSWTPTKRSSNPSKISMASIEHKREIDLTAEDPQIHADASSAAEQRRYSLGMISGGIYQRCELQKDFAPRCRNTWGY